MIHLIETGDAYGGSLSTWAVLDDPANLDVNALLETFLRRIHSEPRPESPGSPEWRAFFDRERGRLKSLCHKYGFDYDPTNHNRPHLTLCFIQHLIHDHGMKEVEYNQTYVEDL